jgi:hypothetical protein
MPIKRVTEAEYLAEFRRSTDMVAEQELAAIQQRKAEELARAALQPARPVPLVSQPAPVATAAVVEPVAPFMAAQPVRHTQPVVAAQPASAAQLPVVVSGPVVGDIVAPSISWPAVQRRLPVVVQPAPAAPTPVPAWSAPALVECPPLACPPLVCPPQQPCPLQPCPPSAPPTYCAPCNTQVLVGNQPLPVPGSCPEPDQCGQGAAVLGAVVGGLLVVVLLLLYHLVRLIRR